VNFAGQQLWLGAKPPALSLVGPAQLVQIGNTKLDVPALRVYGPIRPRIQKGPIQKNDQAGQAIKNPAGLGKEFGAVVHGGYLRYGLIATGILLLTTAFQVMFVALGLFWRTMGGWSRNTGFNHQILQEARIRLRSRFRQIALVMFVTTLLVWMTAAASAYASVSSLGGAKSPAELFGQYYTTPSPVGPKVYGVKGGVIGDSRPTRVGGPLLPNGTKTDFDCNRSTDSLAAELGLLEQTAVANLACPSATIAEGLRGSQIRSGRALPPQVSLLKQIKDLKFVVVMIGPNDLWWSYIMGYCYFSVQCNDNLSGSEFKYLINGFDRDYGDLLQDLADLPTHPRVVIVGSYDALDAGAATKHKDCPEILGPSVRGNHGLNDVKIQTLLGKNGELNQILRNGAEKYDFKFVIPQLTRLCETSPDGQGPDIQGIADSDAFHPTGLGSLRIAAQVAPLLEGATS
jgi:hypothetical protein